MPGLLKLEVSSTGSGQRDYEKGTSADGSPGGGVDAKGRRVKEEKVQ